MSCSQCSWNIKDRKNSSMLKIVSRVEIEKLTMLLNTKNVENISEKSLSIHLYCICWVKMCKTERSWTISGVFKAKAEKVVTSSKRFSQERRWRQEKRKMCLKQNLEAAKLCRVERQMTEEGIIFSIYTCLHLLFLHVLSLFLLHSTWRRL